MSAASFPGSHPPFRCLQYEKQSATSDEKLDESLGTRLVRVYAKP